jgi:hypothetical protein
MPAHIVRVIACTQKEWACTSAVSSTKWVIGIGIAWGRPYFECSGSQRSVDTPDFAGLATGSIIDNMTTQMVEGH